MPRDYAARLVSNERLTEDVADLRFELAGQPKTAGTEPRALPEPGREQALHTLFNHNPLTLRPGQFAHLAAPGVFLRRPISIAGFDPAANLVRFIIRLVGEGTRNLAMLKPGGTTKILLPLGNPFPLDSSGDIWLVGGGLGVAPLLYLAKTLSGTVRGLRSFLGFGDERSVFGAQEMNELSEMTLDIGGFITDRVTGALTSKRPDVIFSCGPKPMMGALKKICAARRVPLYVSLEERMGCGVGACLVCSCAVHGTAGYRRVCRDGPVFGAEEVVLS
ncbi:MAG: dihydroorotate dehydrogenase electron transfer subunit [Synergistaceae bacterium]|jgi:dihydroorotate dehydrogenase electron transfer subunit|nr:dihydroorotate dehydrogenase electron transfer subunit [Synergistaceae bacterium]